MSATPKAKANPFEKLSILKNRSGFCPQRQTDLPQAQACKKRAD
jgi:hypothetical protein